MIFLTLIVIFFGNLTLAAEKTDLQTQPNKSPRLSRVPNLSLDALIAPSQEYTTTALCISPRTQEYFKSLLINDFIFPTINEKKHSILLKDPSHKESILLALEKKIILGTKIFKATPEFKLSEYEINWEKVTYTFYLYEQNKTSS